METIKNPINFNLKFDPNTFEILNFTITRNVLWIAYIVILIIFIVISIGFVYHIEKYGFHKRIVRLAEFVYFTVSLLFLSLMALLILAYPI